MAWRRGSESFRGVFVVAFWLQFLHAKYEDHLKVKESNFFVGYASLSCDFFASRGLPLGPVDQAAPYV